MMTGRFLRTDNMLIVCTFISVYAWKCTHSNERTVFGFVRASSFVHSKKRKKNYEGGNEYSIKYEIIYLRFKWEPWIFRNHLKIRENVRMFWKSFCKRYYFNSRNPSFVLLLFFIEKSRRKNTKVETRIE